MARQVIGLGPDPEGATPLTDEELEGLIPEHVTTRAELNGVESENLVDALSWGRSLARRSDPAELLDPGFLVRLHRQMFSDVWRWAGTQRRRETNIGVDPVLIAERVKVVLDDAGYWHEHATFPADEIAVRVHHRLVAVHPFPNGNGRCTRLIADLYLLATGDATLSWGGEGDLGEPGDVRAAYLESLRAADREDYDPLLRFARAE